MSSIKRRHESGSTSGNPANISLEHVRCFWLSTESSKEDGDKYLLVEDTETGDVLIPLIYMKSILEANYSRKLAALKNREVQVPLETSLREKQGLLFWHWAFECPQPIKRVVRDYLGETKPQGHLRLVLLPIVYNAMASKEELQSHPLFKPLHSAMKASSYWPLVIKPSLENIPGEAEPDDKKLFDGPREVEKTAQKYMFMFESVEDVEYTKRLRTTNVAGDSRFNTAGTCNEFENLDTIRTNNALQDKDRGNDSGGVNAAKDLFQMLMSQDGPQVKYPQYGHMEMDINRLRNTMDARFQELMNEVSSVKSGVMAIMQCLATMMSAEQRPHPQAQSLHPVRGHGGTFDYPKMGNQGVPEDIGVEQIIQLLSRFQNGNNKDVA